MMYFKVDDWLVPSSRAVNIASGKYALPTAMKHEDYEQQKLNFHSISENKFYILDNYWSS